MSLVNTIINKESPDTNTVGSSIRSKSSRKRKQHFVLKTPTKKKSRVRELLGAIALYLLCVSLPTLFGITVRWYERHFSFHRESSSADDALGSGIGNTLLSSGQESISALISNAADVLLSPYHNKRDPFHLVEVPVAVYRFLQRHLRQYIKRDALSDVQSIIVLSLVLSLIRVLIVYLLVPRYLAPRRLAALVHSKSTHLLSSSEYVFTKKKKDGSHDDENELNDNSPLEYLNDLWIQTGHTIRRSLGHEAQTPYENLDATQALRLFQAPRYATAVFRLLFCMLSCSFALVKFSSSNFWPVWVGGLETAQTKNCWDLSGSVAFKGASLDSDFDHQNTALRYFFLGQASYQIHSISFHFLSMALLVLCAGDAGFLSARQSLKSYCRPMLEHSIYFALTVMTYIFSGLRRLGAICIFALELSSMMLQFLQICINAPESSIFRNTKIVKFAHRVVAIPTFIYCRFFVMPFIVQYSAAFESTMWLQNIEHALTPGVGMVIYSFFNGMLLLAFALNFVYLRRLLFHPFVQMLGQRTHEKHE
jgi:hypothetical protein